MSDAEELNWLQKLHRFGASAEQAVDDSATPTTVRGRKQAARLIRLTGALTAIRSVVLPLEAGASWDIENATSGEFAVAVGGATGATVTVPFGATMTVVCNGSGFTASRAPVGLVESGKAAAGIEGVYSYTKLVDPDETMASWNLAHGARSAAYLFDVEVTTVSDDGLDFATYKIFYSVSVTWNGSAYTVAQLAAPVVVITYETSPAACSATLDISGTSVRLRVGGTADWRYGASVHITRTSF